MGASRDGKRGQVVHLDVRRAIATLELPGLPHLGSGITWQRDGMRVMATPNLREGVVTVVDVATWKKVRWARGFSCAATRPRATSGWTR